MIKIQIKSVFGKVLFEYEKENNTVKETLLQAIKESANLYGANLESADLRSANLYGANLYGANLESANLYGASLENALLPIYCKWSFGIVDDKIRIGCKQKTIEDWDAFFKSNEVYDTPRNTGEFNRIYATYKALKEYLLTIKSFNHEN